MCIHAYNYLFLLLGLLFRDLYIYDVADVIATSPTRTSYRGVIPQRYRHISRSDNLIVVLLSISSPRIIATSGILTHLSREARHTVRIIATSGILTHVSREARHAGRMMCGSGQNREHRK